jgi:hypothetical protein
MVEHIGGGDNVADFVVGSGAGVVEGIGLTNLSVQQIVTITGGMVESIGNAQNIANLVVGGGGEVILSIFDLDATILGIVGILSPIAIGIDGGGDVA